MTAIEQLVDEATATDARIGQNVHNMLWARRIMQKDLAAELLVTSSVLSKKLRGSSGWSAVQVEVAANFLGVDVGTLYRQPTVAELAPKLRAIQGGMVQTAPRTMPMLYSVPHTELTSQ